LRLLQFVELFGFHWSRKSATKRSALSRVRIALPVEGRLKVLWTEKSPNSAGKWYKASVLKSFLQKSDQK
jgi:hypothetical protein